MKNKVYTIRITSPEGKDLYKGPINELPLKEEYVLSMSMQLFNDKDPCIIHRTFIAKKFYCELYDTLKSLKEKGTVQPETALLDKFLPNIDLMLGDSRVFIE